MYDMLLQDYISNKSESAFAITHHNNLFNEICRIPARALNTHELVLMQRFRRYTFLLSPDHRHRTSCVATGQSYELECVQQLINFAHNLHRHEME